MASEPMTSGHISLAHVYAGWEDYHRLLVRAIEPLTQEQLALRPAPHLRSIGENTVHIIRTRAGWYHNGLGVGGDAFAALAEYDASGVPERAAADLVQGLEATWKVLAETLAEWTDASLDEVHLGVRRGQTYELRRGWVIWHVFEHDMHHGGEISLTLGMHNLTGLGL